MSSTKHDQRSCFRNGSFGKEEANISHHLLLKLGLQRGKGRKKEKKKGGWLFAFPSLFSWVHFGLNIVWVVHLLLLIFFIGGVTADDIKC